MPPDVTAVGDTSQFALLDSPFSRNRNCVCTVANTPDHTGPRLTPPDHSHQKPASASEWIPPSQVSLNASLRLGGCEKCHASDLGARAKLPDLSRLQS